MPNNTELKEYRCKCGKLLFKGCFNGVIELKCTKCKHIMTFIMAEKKDNIIEQMKLQLS